MSNGHARRAKPSQRSGVGRHGWLIWAAIPLGTIAPAAGYMVWSAPADSDLDGSAPTQIEEAIKYMRFDPLLPPSRLRGPGAFYAVDGGFYWKICDADPELLRDKIHSSPVPSQTRNKFEKAGFSVGSDMLDKLNAKLGASQIVSIEYRMSDVSISEIAASDLFVIQDQLLKKDECDKAVGKMLEQHTKVCPGYAVLTATTSYKINFNRSTTSGAETRLPVEAVQRQIEAETKGEIKLTGAQELLGQDLYYGIRLSPACVTPNTATAPVRLDEAREQPSARAAPTPAPQHGV